MLLQPATKKQRQIGRERERERRTASSASQTQAQDRPQSSAEDEGRRNERRPNVVEDEGEGEERAQQVLQTHNVRSLSPEKPGSNVQKMRLVTAGGNLLCQLVARTGGKAGTRRIFPGLLIKNKKEFRL